MGCFSFTLICSFKHITFTTALAMALAVVYCKPSLHYFHFQNKSMYRRLIPASVKHKVANLSARVNMNTPSALYITWHCVLRCRDNKTVSVFCKHDTVWSVEMVFI